MLSRKLLSLLISLLLVLSPFASLGVAAATTAEEHCIRMDMDMSMGASETVDDYSTFSVGAKSVPGCTHCKSDSCGDTNCAAHGCSTGNLSLLNTHELPMPDYKSPEQFTNSNADPLSYSTPPPLPPPV